MPAKRSVIEQFVEEESTQTALTPEDWELLRQEFGYNPSQARDSHGKWTSGGGGGYVRAERLTESQEKAVAMGMVGRKSLMPGGDEADVALGEIAHFNGFDGLPTLGDVDAVVAAGGVELFRGVSKAEYVEQFKRGDYYPGTGMYGSGIYASTDRNYAAVYSYATAPPMRMALRPDAKVLSRSQLIDAQFGDFEKRHETMMKTLRDDSALTFEKQTAQMRAEIFNNAGRTAAVLGYDAVEQEEGTWVILNRTALVVEP